MTTERQYMRKKNLRSRYFKKGNFSTILCGPLLFFAGVALCMLSGCGQEGPLPMPVDELPTRRYPKPQKDPNVFETHAHDSDRKSFK